MTEQEERCLWARQAVWSDVSNGVFSLGVVEDDLAAVERAAAEVAEMWVVHVYPDRIVAF